MFAVSKEFFLKEICFKDDFQMWNKKKFGFFYYMIESSIHFQAYENWISVIVCDMVFNL